MANKIGILESSQADTDRPNHYTKNRIAKQLHASGYVRKISRVLYKLLRVNFAHALKVVEYSDGGLLKAPGPPSSLNLTYPAKDQRSNPSPFGSKQDWLRFPTHA